MAAPVVASSACNIWDSRFPASAPRGSP